MDLIASWIASGFRRWVRDAAAAALVLPFLVLASSQASAQIPASAQQQLELFNALPAAQQQALIQQLQSQLTPEQRQAFLQALQGQGQTGQTGQPGQFGQVPGFGTAGQLGLSQLDLLTLQQRLGQADLEERNPRFQGGDTLVVQLTRRTDVTPRPAEGTEDEIQQVQQRIAQGNPYQLDRAGQLYLPGVPAIELAGLNVEQATTRLEVEPALRLFRVKVTRLPLEPIGTEALKPFGYDVFGRNENNTLDRLIAPSSPIGGLSPLGTLFSPPTDVPVPVDYVLGPGDVVNVQLFGNQNGQYSLPVNRDGTINFPQLGPINVAGLSFEDSRDAIEQRVSQQMIGVRVSTTLGELRSIRVFIVGDVERPGSYAVSGFSTITNALLKSGGITRIGSLRKIALRRGGDTVSTLDLYDLLLRGDTSDDARLQSGDVIFVPPVGSTVAVDGEVKRPAIYEVEEGATVADVIALAGGLNANANGRDIRIERIASSGGTDVQEVDFSRGGGRQVAVRNGDVLRILTNPDLLDNSVRLSGNVFEPGLHEWARGMRLTDLIPRPELVKPKSDLNYVLIRRELEPNVRIDVLSADLEAAWKQPNGAADLPLEPRDTVYVFNLDVGRQTVVRPILEELRTQAPPQAPQPIVRISGRVRAPGDYPLEPRMHVSDLLRAGGGMSDAAYAVEAELTRYAVVDGQYRETELVNVDLAALLAGDARADLIIEPYDYLNIKEVPRWRGNETVTLRGEVTFPGSYPIRQGEKLSSVLERAGGVTPLAFTEGSVFTRVDLKEQQKEQLETLARRIESDLATLSITDPNNADVIGRGQSLVQQLRTAQATGRLVIRLDSLIAGDKTADITLRDGDELIVPQFRQEVTVLGEVQYPTSHVYRNDLDRQDYLSRSGGLTSRADAKKIYIVRANGEVVANTGGKWFDRGGGAAIRPGDTIVVPTDVERQRPIARWTSVTQILYNLAIAAAAVSSF
jgi:protein involved in polysaccharide export with SLBB domain